MGYKNQIERISDVLAEPIRTRDNNATLNALLGVTDAAGRSVNGNIGDFQARATAPEVTLMDVLGIPDDANGSLLARLGAYTSGAPLKTTVDSIEVDTKYINDVACPAAPVAGSLLQVLVEDIYERTLGEQTLNGLLGVADIAGRSIIGNLGDFQANASLTTLLAVIGGGFETDTKDMYTRLYTESVAYINNVACPAAPVAGSLLQVLVEDIYERTLGEQTLEGLLGVADIAGRSIIGNLGDFQARATAPEVTLMDVLGIPDDANGSLFARLGAYTSAASLKNAIDALAAAVYDGSIKNVMMNRDMPFLTECWETESLDATRWEEIIDGAGTGAFGTSGGYMFYDLMTDAVADNDVILNSKYRWQVIPAAFGDVNTAIEALVLEFEAQIVTAVEDHDNTHFFLGFSSAKSNDITQSDLVGFYLDTDALKGKTDDGGGESTTGAIAATLTNNNKFKIRISGDSVVFSFNGVEEVALTTNLPDEAMYIVLGTRAEGAVAVGLRTWNIRCYYEEVA